MRENPEPDSLLTPEGLCQPHCVEWYGENLEDGLARPKRGTSQRIPSSSKDLPVWPQVTNLLRTLWGRAEITTWTQPHRSCEYNSSPAEKVLENTMLQSFRKMNLSTPLFHAPKLYLPAPWFIQEGEMIVKNKRLGPESNSYLCSQGQLILRLFSVAVKGGMNADPRSHLALGVLKYIFVGWGTLTG